MICKKCGAQLLDTDRFCINCGMQVDVKIENCPFCGEKLREGEKFCHRCGSEIPVPGKEVGPAAGTYPGGLNTTEISALSDAVIAAAQLELGENDRAEAAHAPEAEEEEQEEYPVRIRRVREPSGEAPKRKRKTPAKKPVSREKQGDSDDLLNKMILGAGAVLLVAVAVALFLFARNEGLIPGGGSANEEQQADSGAETPADQEASAGQDGGTAGEPDVSLEEPVGRIRVTAGTLNIRSGATTQGTEIIGKAKKGEVYSYLSVENGWYYIDLGGGEGGYVNEEFVEEE